MEELDDEIEELVRLELLGAHEHVTLTRNARVSALHLADFVERGGMLECRGYELYTFGSQDSVDRADAYKRGVVGNVWYCIPKDESASLKVMR